MIFRKTGSRFFGSCLKRVAYDARRPLVEVLLVLGLLGLVHPHRAVARHELGAPAFCAIADELGRLKSDVNSPPQTLQMLILWTPNDQSLLIICAYENLICATRYLIDERLRYDMRRRNVRRTETEIAKDGNPLKAV